MIRCPDNVAPERREVRGGEFSIGRGKDNQWVVADPDRHLSKKHCQFTYGVGEWEVQDFSTNGTFLNQNSDPIGKGASQKLRNGDRVKFGLYEIEVIIDEEEAGREHDNFLAHHDPLPSRTVAAALSDCAYTTTMYPSISAKRRPSGTPATSSRHGFDFAHVAKPSASPAKMMAPMVVAAA